MIIDSHQHFWKFNPVRDIWIDNSMEVLKQDFMPITLLPVLEKNNVDGCIAIQADQSEEETKFLLKLADEYDIIKGVVGWVDLLTNDFEERLSLYTQHKKFKGIRHIVQAESDDFVLRKDFQYGISKLKQFGLTYDILIYPKQINNVTTLVNSFPNQVFILNHIAKPNIKKGEIETWKKQIERLAKEPNVYCKVSGLVTEADWKHWKYNNFTPYLDVIFNSFGINRVLFGSDWPVCLVAAPYNETLEIIKNYISQFTKEDKDKIMSKNAISVYALEHLKLF